MPTYEYECEACSYRFEQFQSMTAELIKTCPSCQGPVKRLIGAGAGLLFKGSGFYTTDYRSSSYQKKAESDKKNPSPTTSNSGSSCGSDACNKSAKSARPSQ